jgi:hypothetical protein
MIELEKGNEIDRIVEAFYPSIRKMISTLQDYSIKTEVGYSLKLPEKLVVDNEELNVEDVIDLLINKNKPIKAFELAVEKTGQDLIMFYKSLFRYFVENRKDELSALLVAEYLYRHSFVADKEVNLLACLLALKNRALPFVLYDGDIQVRQTTKEIRPLSEEAPVVSTISNQQPPVDTHPVVDQPQQALPPVNNANLPHLPPIEEMNSQSQLPLPQLENSTLPQYSASITEGNGLSQSNQQNGQQPIQQPQVPSELASLFGNLPEPPLETSSLPNSSAQSSGDVFLNSIERNLRDLQ